MQDLCGYVRCTYDATYDASDVMFGVELCGMKTCKMCKLVA